MQKQMKNISKIFILVFTVALMGQKAKAQQVPLYNQYFNATSLVNTAGATFENKRYLSFVYRDQFGGLIGSPKNFALAYNSTVRNNMAFTANLTTADIGFTSQLKFSGGLGYKLFGEGSDGLSLGTQASFSFFSLNEDRVNPENPIDNVLIDLLGQSGSAFSLDLSASYRVGKLGIDVTVPTVINTSLSDDAYIQINDDNVPDFIGGARYEFTINPDLTITPYAGFRLRETIGAELDVMAMANFKDKFSFSAGYRDNYGPTVGIGAQVFPKLMFTYNYDFGDRDTPFLADGFNEFGLHYELNTPEQKANSCIEEGEAVVNRIIDQRIFDANLVNLEDKESALCYLRSLEAGKRKEKNAQAEEAYQALFLKIKEEEMARQEAARVAAMEAEQARKEEEARAERARLAEIEKLRLQELERVARLKEEAVEKAMLQATNAVQFNSGSAILTEGSYVALNDLATLLKENAGFNMSISGYTDSSGNAARNLQLSKERAAAVKDYLVTQGIATSRLAAEGYGIASPIADNATAEGRAKNRRVEMKIVKDK